MTETTFLVPRNTGTHGDVLAAAGLADLLAGVPGAGAVRIRETEIGFAVSVPELVDVGRLPQNPGYPFLKVKADAPVPRGAVDVVDYRDERAKAERRKQARGGAGKRRRGRVEPQTEQAIQEEAPREDWALLQVLNSLQGDETSNRVHAAVVGRAPDRWRGEMTRALTALGDGEPSGLDWKATTVQLFTPTAAKGYCRLKPDSTDRNDKTKDRWADPLVEWLRYRGYFRVACPFFRDSDVRLLCPVPRDISMRALESLTRELRRAGVPGGPPKLDALAVLRMAELLVRHSEEYHDADTEPWPGLSLAGKTPAAAISGVMVTHYQSLGQSRAVSAMATLALPGWFPIRDRHDAETWLAILDEHQGIVRGLKDDHSDEIGLLLLYRRFLERREGSAAWALVGFMEHYGPFLIRARERDRKVRSFRTDHFRETVKDMDTSLTEILDDAGFKAVAAAVRRATVSAQALKAMRRPDYREIRYELLPELRRKRSLPGVAPLMESVADFVASYNVENARRREMGKDAPRNVTTDELSALARLLERHGTSLVGALLCAYGSCREPREGEAVEDQPPTGSQKV
ncbi:MAG: hypothetical protein HY002_22700 [Candidatus Rokubacteria bacterium]|nr:hypothetical protein [Candidatus Rokubacteria bacterium]